MRNQLRIGVYLSYVNLGISCIIPFLYTPIMLGMLGQSEYGLYSLANSVVGYLSLLSFGFGSTIVRYISKYRAENRINELEKTYGFFLVLYCFLSTLVVIGGFILSKNIDAVFTNGLIPSEIDKMKILVIIMSVSTAISFPLSVFTSLTIAYEKYLFRKILDIIATMLVPILNLIVLYLGYASIGLAISSILVQILLGWVNIVYCNRQLALKPRFSILPSKVICEMIGFSIFIFIGSIVDMLFWATDKVILGIYASTVVVAIYNVGVTFNSMVMTLSTSISGVLVPRITGMVVTNTDKSEWTNLFIKVGRIQFLIIALIISGFSVFGQTFIRLWVGVEYLEAFWVAVLTMFPLAIPLIQNTGISFITAQNKHAFRSIVYLIIAIMNVISTCIVVPYYGMIGAAICSCISYLLGQGIIMNLYYHKVTGLNILLFWENIAKMMIIPTVMLAMGVLIIKYIYINSWLAFFAGIIVFTTIYAILMYKFVMNPYEKDILLLPIKRFCFILKKENYYDR